MTHILNWCSVPFIAYHCAVCAGGAGRKHPAGDVLSGCQGHCDCMRWLNTNSPAPKGVTPSSPCLGSFFTFQAT